MVFFIHWHIFFKKNGFREGSSCLTYLPDVQLEVNPSVFPRKPFRELAAAFPSLHYTSSCPLTPRLVTLPTAVSNLHTHAHLSSLI